LKLTLKLKNELKVLDVIKDNSGISFTRALERSGMHRKTFYEALKRLQKQGIVEKYSWSKRKHYYCINKEAAQIYLFKRGKLGLGTKYDQNFFFLKKITREQLTLAKDMLETISFFGFKTIEKWRCPIIQHSSEKVVYSLTEDGIWAYCSEIGCKYGVYGDFTQYGLQKELERDIVSNKKNAVINPKLSTADHLKAVIYSDEFKIFCERQCPLRAWKVKGCGNQCTIRVMRETLRIQTLKP
jgi:DNA-binding PadR family transcriptional regulator